MHIHTYTHCHFPPVSRDYMKRLQSDIIITPVRQLEGQFVLHFVKFSVKVISMVTPICILSNGGKI